MSWSRRRGWTLVELMLVMAIIATVMGMGIPSYWDALDRARVAQAAGDIEAIQADLAGHEFLGRLPTTLAEIGRGGMLDPWGRPYEYLPFTGGEIPRGARKERFLVPINSTYDLYSKGKDGVSRAPLTAAASHDDVVRAMDGAFIGRASEF